MFTNYDIQLTEMSLVPVSPFPHQTRRFQRRLFIDPLPCHTKYPTVL